MSEAPPRRPVISYNEEVIKKFTIAAMFWAIVAFLVGIWIASELCWPELSFGLSFLNFGRLRPVHTSAAIFAFGGNALFATSFFVVQRTCRARLAGPDALHDFIFWGYSSSSSWRRSATSWAIRAARNTPSRSGTSRSSWWSSG